MSDFYVETTIFRDLKAELKLEHPFRNIVFLAGCKGVGKTSLLKALYNDVRAHKDEYNVTSEDNVYYLISADTITSKAYSYGDILEKMLDMDSTGYLFIDNVQELPSDCSHFKRILKEPVNMNWQVVAASSRHGLFSLIKMNILSVDESLITNLCVLSPEEEVGETIFLRLMERQNENERRTLEDCQKDLAFLGYVPGCIRAYVTFKCDLNAYKIAYETSSWNILLKDAEHYSVYSDGDELYCKTLAILCSGNSVPLHPFHLAPALLPWTFLKHECRDDGDHVSAVSPLAQDICANYICSDTDHLVKRIEAMLQITGGELGNLGGRLFEQIIHARLLAIRSITYFYYDNENTNITSQELNLAAVKNFQSNKRDVSGIRTSGTASITHCPNAKHLDFVLVLKDGGGEKTHGIQVTLETRSRKCSISNFFEEGDANYIYLLTPHLVDVESLEGETSRNTALRRAFKEKHLRIIDPSTVLTSEQMELMRRCSAN